MSSAKPKFSFPKTLAVLETAPKETSLSRWLDLQLGALEEHFDDFITVQSARRAAKANAVAVCKSR